MKQYQKVMLGFILLSILPNIGYSAISFTQIKDRKVAQFELTDIMLDLARNRELDILNRWVELSPKSFKDLNFTKAYLLAGERSLAQHSTNQALVFFIKSYQSFGKDYVSKVSAAYKTAFFLYAQKKRLESLFYINRAIELLVQSKTTHELASDIFYLKRRIVWRYFSQFDALPDNAISSIDFDGDDVWIGMWSGGAGRFSRSLSQLDLFNPKNSKLPSYYVRSILIRPDKVWVATHCGLSYFQKFDATWHTVDSFNDFKLKEIIYDGTYYYVATLFNGVYRSIDGISWENIIPRHSVLDLLSIEDDLYIGTPERGVFNYSQNILESFLPDISAKTIIVDEDDRFLWIGTYGQGLIKVNRKNKRIIEQFDKKELKSDYIESLALIDGRLWIGTLESGVAIYDLKTKKWEYLGLQDGLPGLDITSITQENEHIWFGTMAGGIGIYLFKERNTVGGRF